jgi:hypothetical protein
VNSDLTLCGCRVRTELPLPELLEWDGDARDPELFVTRVPVANIGNESTSIRPLGLLTGVSASGTWTLDIPTVGTIKVSAGTHIQVSIHDPSSEAHIRPFVLGPALAACCSQRNLLPLSASVVARGGRAIAIIGNPGVGKSAVALALTRVGYGLVSDGITVLRESPHGPQFEALATFPFHQVWRRAVFSLNLPVETMTRTRPCLEKYLWPFTGPFNPVAATPLSDIVILRRESDDDVTTVASGKMDPVIGNLMRSVACDHRYSVDASTTELFGVLPRLALTVRAHVVTMSEDADIAARIDELIAP